MAGLIKRNGQYAIQYYVQGQRRTWTVGRYLDTARTIQVYIDRLRRLRLSGEQPSGDLARWIENLSDQSRDRLVAWELLDAARLNASLPLWRHLLAYGRSLRAGGTTKDHYRRSVSRCAQVLKRARVAYWSQVTPAKVQAVLATMRKDGLSTITLNHYMVSAKGFGNWLVREGRTQDNILKTIRPLPPQHGDRKHQRRALSDAEVTYLLEYVVKAPTIFGMTGWQRQALYATAVNAGLRLGDLKPLCHQSFNLSDHPATLTIQAFDEKNRKGAVLPLKADLAELLARYLAKRPIGEPIFPMPCDSNVSKMIKCDLDTARAQWIDQASTPEQREQRSRMDFLAYQDSAGRFADFHALRHTFITNCTRSGMPIRLAMELARHSDPKLTMKTYGHVTLLDTAKALESLPVLRNANNQHAVKQATKTDDQREIVAGHRAAILLTTDTDLRRYPSLSDNQPPAETQRSLQQESNGIIGLKRESDGKGGQCRHQDSNLEPRAYESLALAS